MCVSVGLCECLLKMLHLSSCLLMHLQIRVSEHLRTHASVFLNEDLYFSISEYSWGSSQRSEPVSLQERV